MDYLVRDAKKLRRLLKKVEEKPGYKSLFNTAEPAEIAEVTSQDKGKKDKGPNTPKDGKVSANIDLELFSSSDLSGPLQWFLTKSWVRNRIDTDSDIVGSSIVSLAMPVETLQCVCTKNDGLMRYPIIPPPFGYDHILIESFNYVPMLSLD